MHGQWKRREFLTLLGGAAAWPLAARAQQGERVRRVGVFMGIANDSEGQGRVAAFRQELQTLGWIEGRNVVFDYRWAPRDAAHAGVFANELVQSQPHVIITLGTPATIAVRDATRVIPVVFISVTDPIGSGLVQSWARPSSNITGFTNFEPSMSGKWLELLRTLLPGITRVGYLFNSDTTPGLYPRTVDEAAPVLSLKSVAVVVRHVADIEPAIESFAREPDGSLLVLPDVFTTINRQRIIALAALHRLPAMYTFRHFAAEGGLMSYGIDVTYLFRQAALYVDRILRGTRPADLPVQGPVKLNLVINLKTAKVLGLTVPPTLLATADEVIE